MTAIQDASRALLDAYADAEQERADKLFPLAVRLLTEAGLSVPEDCGPKTRAAIANDALVIANSITRINDHGTTRAG